MIKIINKAYQVGETVYTDITEAQAAQLQELCPEVQDFGKLVMNNKDAVIDILTTKANSRPRARKANGGTKNRKSNESAPVAQSESATVS